jgi:hypothetical protein
MTGRLMNNELKNLCKQAVVTLFEVLSLLLEGTEEKYENPVRLAGFGPIFEPIIR